MIDAQVEANLGPFRTAVEQIMSIPGNKNLGAQAIASEIGIDMSRFPSDAHLISWAGICPRNDESAGKRRSNRLRKGAPWLKTTLVQCALGGGKKEKQLPASPILPHQSQARARDVTAEIAAEISKRFYDDDELAPALRDFLERAVPPRPRPHALGGRP
jgi:transposase